MPDRVAFSQKPYDLLVIGGGINGAAIANIAADNGFKVALVEKGDFAGGTSSKSTKLIHGGLRYLEHFEFALVRESLKERFIQLQNAPHLVKPLEFVLPVYKTDSRPFWMIKLGVWFYDILGKGERPPVPDRGFAPAFQRHRFLSASETRFHAPGIKKEGLLGGVTYCDAQMDDARLCLENVLSAKAKGADVANYVEACSFLKENGKVVGIQARDVLGKAGARRDTGVKNGETAGTGETGETARPGFFEIRAKRVVCAVGPWTNRLLKMENPAAKKRIRATKGIHIVYKKQISDKAVLLQTQKNSRIFFVIPWGEHSLVGTTDTDFSGDPDNVKADDEDIRYLFEEAARFFPDITFQKEDIITTFAGLRPLVHAPGDPSLVSRKYLIEEVYYGVVYVTGGKYTIYRKMAEECVRKVLKVKKMNPWCGVYGSEIPGKPAGLPEISDAAEKYGVDQEVVDYLKSKYGSRYCDVLELTCQPVGANNHSPLQERICSCSPAIAAQIVYSIQTEMACTSDDIIWRRLGLGYRECKTGNCRKRIEKYVPCTYKVRT